MTSCKCSILPRLLFCTLFGTTAVLTHIQTFQISVTVSFWGQSHTFFWEHFLVGSLTFQATETLFTFGFAAWVQKQFRIYLSHTLRIRLTAFSKTPARLSLITSSSYAAAHCSSFCCCLRPDTTSELKQKYLLPAYINLDSSNHTLQCAR